MNRTTTIASATLTLTAAAAASLALAASGFASSHPSHHPARTSACSHDKRVERGVSVKTCIDLSGTPGAATANYSAVVTNSTDADVQLDSVTVRAVGNGRGHDRHGNGPVSAPLTVPAHSNATVSGSSAVTSKSVRAVTEVVYASGKHRHAEHESTPAVSLGSDPNPGKSSPAPSTSEAPSSEAPSTSEAPSSEAPSSEAPSTSEMSSSSAN